MGFGTSTLFQQSNWAGDLVRGGPPSLALKAATCTDFVRPASREDCRASTGIAIVARIVSNIATFTLQLYARLGLVCSDVENSDSKLALLFRLLKVNQLEIIARNVDHPHLRR
jgi:hypothetical protein